MTIDEIYETGEKILNHWALTDTKQLGLHMCTIAAEYANENEALKADLQNYTDCQACGNMECFKRKGSESCKWKWRGATK